MSDSLLPWVIGLGGSAGLVAVIREGVSVIRLVRKGVSAKEGKRKTDIVQQRDEALDQAARDRVIADHEAKRRRELEEYASRLRRQLFETTSATVADVEQWPEDKTLTRAEVDRIVHEHYNDG